MKISIRPPFYNLTINKNIMKKIVITIILSCIIFAACKKEQLTVAPQVKEAPKCNC